MIKKEGGKWVLFSKDGSKRLGEFDSKAAAQEREREIQAIKHAKAEVSMIITKASLHEDGTMRWCATVSDTQPDRTGERTSLSLFQDWIERVEKSKGVDFLPPPRVPFLGVSHYPSLDGDGEAGVTEKMYIDGKQFKVSGVFLDTPLGKSLFEAVRSELETVKKGGTIEQPIRISAAWWDLEHSHGKFIFTRRSLTEACPMCAEGARDKAYLKGQPDHWASTRVPIHPRTALGLEEKSMSKIKREDDAASIVGEQHAAELEKKTQKLVGKSETEEMPALVVKADEETTEPDAATLTEKATGEAMGDEEGYRPLGGAVSMGDADSFIQTQAMMDRLYTNWDIFRIVVDNILSAPDGTDKVAAIGNVTKEFGDRVDTLKANVTDAFLVAQAMVSATSQPASVEVEKGETIVTEEIETTEQPEAQINDPSALLGTSVQTALSDPALSREAKLEAIQDALNSYAGAVKAQLDTVAPPPPGEEIVQAIEKSMGAFAEKLELLIAKMDVGQPVAPSAVPQQKSFTPTGPVQPQAEQQLPVSPISGEPSKLRAMIERSVIGH